LRADAADELLLPPIEMTCIVFEAGKGVYMCENIGGKPGAPAEGRRLEKPRLEKHHLTGQICTLQVGKSASQHKPADGHQLSVRL
jgi:hypothetical protein